MKWLARLASIACMDLDVWLVYLLTAIGLSLSPGPNGLLALTHGALHGRRMTLFTILGGSVGFITIIALSLSGIGALLQTSLIWLTVMKWVGGTYLVWLGIQVWRAPPIGRRPSGRSSRWCAEIHKGLYKGLDGRKGLNPGQWPSRKVNKTGHF